MEWTLALKLLAVYIGTAAASLRLAHRFVSPIRLRVALFLGLAPFLFVGKAMLTGGVYAPIDIPYQAPPLSVHSKEMGTEHTQTPLLSDVAFQEIPWRKAVRDAAKNGRLPLWNRFVLSGEPLLAVQQPAVLHPATWIGMLLPLAQGWSLEMALRFLLAILAAYLFLREIGCGEVPSLLGGAAWAFSDYLVFFVGYPLTPAAAPLPLLLLGLRRLVTTADRSAVAITVIALFLITASGHPETLLHCVAGGGLYFLFELFWAEPRRRARALALAGRSCISFGRTSSRRHRRPMRSERAPSTRSRTAFPICLACRERERRLPATTNRPLMRARFSGPSRPPVCCSRRDAKSGR